MTNGKRPGVRLGLADKPHGGYGGLLDTVSLARGRLRRTALDRPVLWVRVTLAPVEVAVELGRAGAQVVQRQLGFVGLALGIISERAPHNRIMVVAAEQPACFEHRVGNRSAHLIEHQSLDRAELCAVAPVDSDMLHAITRNHCMMHGVLSVSHHSMKERSTRGRRYLRLKHPVRVCSSVRPNPPSIAAWGHVPRLILPEPFGV